MVHFRLYIVGGAPNSCRALENIREIGKTYLANCYSLEIVDVLEQPLRALQDGVLITPMLIRLREPPVRIVGNLSDKEKVCRALGLNAVT